MKKYLSSLIIALLAVIVAWQWHHYRGLIDENDRELQLMKTHVHTLETQVLALEQGLADAESRSIETVLEDANELLVEGWAGVLKEFKNELERAKDNVLGKNGQHVEQGKPANPPNGQGKHENKVPDEQTKTQGKST